ncbi:hypothetical protein ACFWAR_25410 [Streptomyces sp. NPDC059917]|uniref:hypothetical protein n=1 Tax=Streptomyces sp. NPDC059917 TaxID=3347002 RepID=UPI00365FCE10
MTRIAAARAAAWAAPGTLLLFTGIAVVLVRQNGWHTYPQWYDSTDFIVRWFAENRTTSIWLALVGNVYALVLVWLTIDLTRLLGGPGGRGGTAVHALTPMALVWTGGFFAAGVFWVAASTAGSSESHFAAPDLVRLSFEVSIGFWLSAQTALGVLMLCAAAAVRSAGLFPPWTVRSAALLGVVNLLGTAALFVDRGPFAPSGWLSGLPNCLAWIWFAAVAVLMKGATYRSARASAHPRPSSGKG